MKEHQFNYSHYFAGLGSTNRSLLMQTLFPLLKCLLYMRLLWIDRYINDKLKSKRIWPELEHVRVELVGLGAWGMGLQWASFNAIWAVSGLTQGCLDVKKDLHRHKLKHAQTPFMLTHLCIKLWGDFWEEDIMDHTEDESATGSPENPQWLAGLHRGRERQRDRERQRKWVCKGEKIQMKGK